MNQSLFLVLLLLCLFTSTAANAQNRPILIKYSAYNPIKSSLIAKYETDLYHALHRYAPNKQRITLEPVYTPMSPLRYREELSKGIRLNTFLAPIRTDINHDAIIVKVPVMKGLLGFRQLLVQRETEQQLKQVTQLSDLYDYSIGQVEGWTDLRVYQANGFETQTGHSIDGIFRMLALKRFDLFPLGAIEIDSEYAKRSHHFRNIVKNDNILLYYPLPVFFHVSPHDFALASFLQHALESMNNDGFLDELIEKHFGEAIANINNKNLTLLRLNNPSLPEDVQKTDKNFWHVESISQGH